MIIENNKEELDSSLNMAINNIQYVQKRINVATSETVEGYLETVKAQVEEALKIVYKNSHN